MYNLGHPFNHFMSAPLMFWHKSLHQSGGASTGGATCAILLQAAKSAGETLVQGAGALFNRAKAAVSGGNGTANEDHAGAAGHMQQRCAILGARRYEKLNMRRH